MPTYLGIDFGTSNTHVAYCNDQGDGALTAVAIKIAGKSPTATCVLWGTAPDGTEIVEAFGTVAMETWSQYDSEEQAGKRIACGFKPDIARSERARIDAGAFLAKVCQSVVDVQPAAVRAGQTIIGVPAEISQEHRDRTREIVRAAGFAEAVCVDEPLGALAYHLTNGSITPSEAHIGIVVVDFGGGTLDLALVTAEQGLRAPWGDPALGGRLFDDLYYQWIQDQNGEFEVSEREALAVWQQECREMKKSFSRRWAMIGDGMNDFRFRIDVGDGRRTLRNASVAEFLERARLPAEPAGGELLPALRLPRAAGERQADRPAGVDPADDAARGHGRAAEGAVQQGGADRRQLRMAVHARDCRRGVRRQSGNRHPAVGRSGGHRRLGPCAVQRAAGAAPGTAGGTDRRRPGRG